MRIVIQRVSHASVTIDGVCKSAIQEGFMILVGIENADTQEDADWLCKKIVNLRVFDDENGVMNKSILDVNGNILVVSQFTLHASYKKGNRPSYIYAAKPDVRRAPPAGLASGAASPELGLWAGTQTRRIRPQTPAHVSAGEESAREPTSLTHFLGTHGVSLWECGDAKPSQGPLEPGALRAELCLGGQGTAEGALLLPFASL